MNIRYNTATEVAKYVKGWLSEKDGICSLDDIAVYFSLDIRTAKQALSKAVMLRLLDFGAACRVTNKYYGEDVKMGEVKLESESENRKTYRVTDHGLKKYSVRRGDLLVATPLREADFGDIVIVMRRKRLLAKIFVELSITRLPVLTPQYFVQHGDEIIATVVEQHRPCDL